MAALYGEVGGIPVNVGVPMPDSVVLAIVAADGERLCWALCSDLTDNGVWDFIDGLSVGVPLL